MLQIIVLGHLPSLSSDSVGCRGELPSQPGHSWRTGQTSSSTPPQPATPPALNKDDSDIYRANLHLLLNIYKKMKQKWANPVAEPGCHRQVLLGRTLPLWMHLLKHHGLRPQVVKTRSRSCTRSPHHCDGQEGGVSNAGTPAWHRPAARSASQLLISPRTKGTEAVKWKGSGEEGNHLGKVPPQLVVSGRKIQAVLLKSAVVCLRSPPPPRVLALHNAPRSSDITR